MVKVKKLKGKKLYEHCSVGTVEHRMKELNVAFQIHFVSGSSTTLVVVCVDHLRVLADNAFHALGE